MCVVYLQRHCPLLAFFCFAMFRIFLGCVASIANHIEQDVRMGLSKNTLTRCQIINTHPTGSYNGDELSSYKANSFYF